MLSYYNHSDTCVVVLHEIYGINEHMKSFCKKTSEYKWDVICPNLLEEDKYYDYLDGDEAYKNFKENIGFDRAIEKLKELLYKIRDEYERVIIIGFSVGATIGWLCSEERGLCDLVIGYYGSRIRDYIEVKSKCPVLLFFPKQEESFKVDDLIGELRDKDNLLIYKFEGNHGFADYYADKYSVQSAQKAEQVMINAIEKAVNSEKKSKD